MGNAPLNGTCNKSSDCKGSGCKSDNCTCSRTGSISKACKLKVGKSCNKSSNCTKHGGRRTCNSFDKCGRVGSNSACGNADDCLFNDYCRWDDKEGTTKKCGVLFIEFYTFFDKRIPSPPDTFPKKCKWGVQQTI